MTVFRADRLCAAALVAAAFLIPGDGFAQGPPPATQRAVPARPVFPTEGGVEVGALGAPDGPPVGLMDSASGGLPSDIWQDSPRDKIEDMLGRLPIATAVPSVRSLARRLLLTTADAPLGAAAHAFLTVRLRKLLEGGLVGEAAEMALKDQLKTDAELQRLKAEALLFAGRDSAICGPATSERLSDGDVFWVELRAYCYAQAQDQDALELTRSVMHAQGLADPAFDVLLGDVADHTAFSPGDIAAPTALHVYLLNRVGLPVEASLGTQLGIPASLVAMRSANNSPSEKLAAAEAVAPTGAASSTELAAICDAQAFSADQLDRAAAAASSMPFLAGQALLRQAVAHESRAPRKAALIYQALTLGARAGRLIPASGLQADAAAAITPDPGFREMAPIMATALLIAGKVDAAERWPNALNLNAASDHIFASAFAAALDLASPSPARDAAAQQGLSWLLAHETPPQSPDAQYAALVRGLREALGLPDSGAKTDDAKSLAVTPVLGRRPAPGVLLEIDSGLKDPGREGEALLAMLDFIGKEGPSNVAPDVTARFVKALMNFGLPEAAHELALDSLLLFRPVAPPAPAAPSSPTVP